VGAGVGNNRSPTAPLFFRIMVIVIVNRLSIVCVVVHVVVCINAVVDSRSLPVSPRNYNYRHNVCILAPPPRDHDNRNGGYRASAKSLMLLSPHPP
jgi:hypothetical protein